MRIGTVVGRVTLSVRAPQFRGERLMLALPWRRETLQGESKFSPAIVVYDELGAGPGQLIAISEGREAACPFPKPTPVDAYCAALLDSIEHKP
jgi:microcompartment protein CcmK/EutM